jgi:hypothetical protein
MAARSRIRRAVTIARSWQPQTYWQVWLSAAGLPLVVLIVGVGLRLIFRTWPQFDVFGAITTIGYMAVRGGAGTRALRTRRKILQLAAASDCEPRVNDLRQ